MTDNTTIRTRFAFSYDSNEKKTLVYVDGGNKDAMDSGYMNGSHVYDLSPTQHAKLVRLVSQDKDGSEIPFEIRVAGSGVRIYEF